ncbi:MAG: YkgJ family cysteine cluster protein [archaeon]
MPIGNKFLKACQECKGKCCKMGGPDFSKAEMEKVLKAGHKNFFVKVSGNHYELKSKGGVCPYLKNNFSCKIHKVRPLMCICWPAVPILNGKKKLYMVECNFTKLLSEKQKKRLVKRALKLDNEVNSGETKLPAKDIELVNKRFRGFKKKRIK